MLERHGWVTSLPGGVVARCGGPAICSVCQAEERALQGAPVHTCAYCGTQGPWKGFEFPLVHRDYPETRWACPEHESQAEEESDREWHMFFRGRDGEGV